MIPPRLVCDAGDGYNWKEAEAEKNLLRTHVHVVWLAQTCLLLASLEFDRARERLSERQGPQTVRGMVLVSSVCLQMQVWVQLEGGGG
jgi:hypothetical protein